MKLSWNRIEDIKGLIPSCHDTTTLFIINHRLSSVSLWSECNNLYLGCVFDLDVLYAQEILHHQRRHPLSLSVQLNLSLVLRCISFKGVLHDTLTAINLNYAKEITRTKPDSSHILPSSSFPYIYISHICVYIYNMHVKTIKC